MDFTNLQTLVAGVGFPIAMCIMLVSYIKTSQDKFVEAIQALTVAVTKLETKLDELEERIRNGS